MTITREQAIKYLGSNIKKLSEFVEQGKLQIVKVGFGGRKYYDRNQVIELAEKLKQPKEL